MERLKAAGFVFQTQAGDPRQQWILVRQDPQGNEKGCFFVTHAKNFETFDRRPGFEVLMRGNHRQELTDLARRATIVCGEAYQPKFSAHNQKPAVLPDEGEGDLYDDLVEQPLHSVDDFLNQAPPSDDDNN